MSTTTTRTKTKSQSQSQSHTTYLTLKFRLQKAIRQLGLPISILSQSSTPTNTQLTTLINNLTPTNLTSALTTLETLPSLFPNPNPDSNPSSDPNTSSSTTGPPQPIPFYTKYHSQDTTSLDSESESDAQKFLTLLTNLTKQITTLQTTPTSTPTSTTTPPYLNSNNNNNNNEQSLPPIHPLLTPFQTTLKTLTQTVQTSITTYAETLRSWEVSHPIEAAQEYELSTYSNLLEQLLLLPHSSSSLSSTSLAESTSTSISPLVNVSAKQWEEVEISLNSLEKYLVETKIRGEQVGRSGIEGTLREVMAAFVELDRQGVEGCPGDFDKRRVERVWGLVDKIGSGVNYLMVVDGRDPVQKATTRSIFLLKSAPPATFHLSSSQEEWCTKMLSSFRDRLASIVLDPSNPIQREDESRWNSTYQELEKLEEFLEEISGMPGQVMNLESVEKSKIGDTITIVCKRLEALHFKRKVGEDEAEFALMHVSWELAMRIREIFTSMEG